MGTNYYAKRKLEYPLTFVVNSDEELLQLKQELESLEPVLHLGKTSVGWSFLANWNGGRYYDNDESFIEFIRDTELAIYDEYQVPLSKLEFLNIVWGKGKRHCGAHYKQFPDLDFLDGGWF